ncbi:MAG: sensor histidine kinase, partial [Bdellovibrionales bacterium]|nr:sensor histidine kinase [Bdellovibrionales bacterium]
FARHTLQIQISDLTRQLLRRVEEEASGLAPSQAVMRERNGLGDFISVVWMGDRRNTSWMAVKPGWNKRFSLSVFDKQKERLPLLIVKDNSVIWTRLTEENGRPLFAMMVEAQSQDGSKGIAVGILGPQTFSDLGGFYKAQSAELILVDDKGFALAYTSPQYVGAQIVNHPAVELLVGQLSVAASGAAKNMEGELTVFAYERLGDSNLYVILTNPLDTAGHYLPGYLFNLAGMALALSLLAGAVTLTFVRRQSFSFDFLKESLRKLAAGQTFLVPDERNKDLDDIRDDLVRLSGGVPERLAHAQTVKNDGEEPFVGIAIGDLPKAPEPMPEIDKAEILKEIGLGLVDSLRPSMAAILGHAQLARSKAGEDDKLKQHFVVIERESRRVREVLENLEHLVGDEAGSQEKVDLQDSLLSVLASMRTTLQDKGIHLKKNLEENGPVMVAPKSFRFVVEEIIHNAVTAMESSAKRELEIWTEARGQNITIVFKDSGKGISRDNLGRVFDPFYTSQAREERSGLGLTMVKRILSGINGEIKISSEEGQGTEVRITLPLVGAERRAFSDEETMKILTPQKELEEMTLSSISIEEGSGIKILSVQSGEDPGGESVEELSSLEKTPAPNLDEMTPLTGSGADHLPAAPSEDEITFVGKVINHDDVFGKIPGETDESAGSTGATRSPADNTNDRTPPAPPKIGAPIVTNSPGEGLQIETDALVSDKSVEIDVVAREKVDLDDVDLDFPGDEDDDAGGFAHVDLKVKTAEALIDDLLDEDEEEADEFAVQIRSPKIKV